MPRLLATSLLLLTTLLWGFAFVAQKTAMADLGPLTFQGVRFLIGSLFIAPLAIREWRRVRPRLSRRDLMQIALLCASFFIASTLQQVGLMMTTATNGGFLTSLYVLFVPLLALAFMRRLPHPVVWVCMPMAIIGVFLLGGGHLEAFTLGDLLILACALGWAVQVLILGDIARSTGLPVTVSVLCFVSSALLSAVWAVPFERADLHGFAGAWVELAYSGILSTAVAFTLQAIAQQYLPPANAAIVLSSESLFAALGGALLLGERLPPIGYFGAVLIFVAILLVETVPAVLTRRSEDTPALAGRD
jgi:drug/metabolite transporter (DMT)-like permease